ncbi:MAG TPA: ribosome-associated translation inhibitor RaiA [Leifsonia sp.]|nr:sigma-54 modulation protein [Microbacteriaceae bacterium]HEV7811535.1 ribosome-associated translation inhibitor RaiA [Leifsonia sp.]
MDISVNGLGVGITDRFKDYATEKSERAAHLADRALRLEVKVTRHSERNGVTGSGDDRVELTLICPGQPVRAESNGSDKYVAFDLALDKLLERLRRAKDRRKVHRGQHRPTSLREAATDGFSEVDITPADPELIERVATGAVPIVTGDETVEEEWSPVVIRKKVFAAVPMTVDDALYYMELVGHDFYLFMDAETDRPSVVYRRKGWDYGVIGLDDQSDDLQEVATASRASRR